MHCKGLSDWSKIIFTILGVFAVVGLIGIIIVSFAFGGSGGTFLPFIAFILVLALVLGLWHGQNQNFITTTTRAFFNFIWVVIFFFISLTLFKIMGKILDESHYRYIVISSVVIAFIFTVLLRICIKKLYFK